MLSIVSAHAAPSTASRRWFSRATEPSRAQFQGDHVDAPGPSHGSSKQIGVGHRSELKLLARGHRFFGRAEDRRRCGRALPAGCAPPRKPATRRPAPRCPARPSGCASCGRRSRSPGRQIVRGAIFALPSQSSAGLVLMIIPPLCHRSLPRTLRHAPPPARSSSGAARTGPAAPARPVFRRAVAFMSSKAVTRIDRLLGGHPAVTASLWR